MGKDGSDRQKRETQSDVVLDAPRLKVGGVKRAIVE